MSEEEEEEILKFALSFFLLLVFGFWRSEAANL